MRVRALLALLLAGLAAGCGGASVQQPPPPRPIAVDGQYRLSATTADVARGRAVRALVCRPGSGTRFGVHVELFVNGLVVLLPAGIGVAPPWQGRPPAIAGGRCSYPLRTLDATGVVEADAAAGPLTLGDAFAIWGQPLSPAGFGPWHTAPGELLGVYVNGVPFGGDPRDVSLRRHAEIVLEIGSPRVAPHARYRFAPNL